MLSGFIYCGICGHKYCGDTMQSGKERVVVGSYVCNNRKNHGVHVCNNLGIQQKPLEELVIHKIEEIVFDEDCPETTPERALKFKRVNPPRERKKAL